MKKLSLYTLIVICSFLTLDYVIGRLFDNLYEKVSNDPSLIAFKNQSDMVMLGSSEMHDQYVTNIITDSLGMTAYNYGASGQNIFFQYAILNIIINHSGHLPKYVLTELSYIDFYDTPGWNTEKLNELYPLYEKDDSLKSIVDLKGWTTPYVMKVLKCFKHNSNLFKYAQMAFSTKETINNGGYCPIEPVDYKDPIETVSTKKEDRLSMTKLDYFYRLIRLCKIYKIKLIVINAPYYELHHNELWMETLDSILRTEGIPHLNYDNDPFFIAHQEWYYNSAHFNKIGAEIYTKRIIPDLRRTIDNLNIKNKQ